MTTAAKFRPFAYLPLPLRSLPWEENAKVALQHYARTQRWGSFAESLLRQQGRWSDKQKSWVNRFIRSYEPIRRIRESDEWRDRCVHDWITEVGAAAAAAHAAELKADAEDTMRRVDDGMSNAECHNKWTRRHWDAARQAADNTLDRANHILRVLNRAN